jgi:hypothetical protein
VSVHLDDRHSSSLSAEKSYNALRGAQAKAVYLVVNGIRKAGEKIIYAGRLQLLAGQSCRRCAA